MAFDEAAPATRSGGARAARAFTAPDVAVVLVHYHAPRQTTAAVTALGRDLEAAGLSAEWRVVDNGSTAEERGVLAELGLPLLEGGGNLGFAAGVNRGIESASAERLFVLNPDVEVLPGCARALVDELERGAGAAAPRLYWDRGKRFLLPPGEERTRRWELLVLAARRSRWFERRARRRWRRDARRHWEAAGSLRSLRLSGALLAISRAAWRRVGTFDEAYRLYFEETDWLLRLAASGLEARQAAGAQAVHGFAHSTKGEPQAAAWFAESARRFRAVHYGERFARLHDRLAAAIGRRRHAGPPRWSAAENRRRWSAPASPDDVLWVELSPNREGFPAAAERVPASALADWEPPVELMRASGLAGMSVCVANETGRELGRWWVSLDGWQGAEKSSVSAPC